MTQVEPSGTVYRTNNQADAIAWIAEQLGLTPDAPHSDVFSDERYSLQFGAQDVFVVESSVPH